MFMNSFDDRSRFLKCVDSLSGKELWSRSIPKARKETAAPPSDPACCTPVCDGKLVCAFFSDAGMIVTDLNGEILWQKDLGPFYSMHRTSALPIIIDNKLIITVDQLQNPFIVALDAKTGDQVWKTERLVGIIEGYSTPVQMKFNKNDGGVLISFDPDSGNIIKRQRLTEATGQYYASTISDGEQMILANLEGKMSLIQLGGDWKPLATIDLEERIVATPMIHEGRLFVRTESMLYCFSADKSAG